MSKHNNFSPKSVGKVYWFQGLFIHKTAKVWCAIWKTDVLIQRPHQGTIAYNKELADYRSGQSTGNRRCFCALLSEITCTALHFHCSCPSISTQSLHPVSFSEHRLTEACNLTSQQKKQFITELYNGANLKLTVGLQKYLMLHPDLQSSPKTNKETFIFTQVCELGLFVPKVLA